MKKSILTKKAFNLLGEVEKSAERPQIINLERFYLQYKTLVNNHRASVPSRTVGNLPFLAMGIQMAKLKDRPDSIQLHLKSTYNFLKSDLEYLLRYLNTKEKAA